LLLIAGAALSLLPAAVAPSSALVGMLFLGLLSNVLVMLNVATFWHEPINGAVLLLAITLDILVWRWHDSRRSYAALARSVIQA